MSHLKEYKTNINNFEYLKKALSRMNVSYELLGYNIIIPQEKEIYALFCWNSKGYTLLYDLDCWGHPLTVNSFMEKAIREYSAEKVIHEMKKFDFDTECYKDSCQSDEYQTVKSKALILSRYGLS